MSGSATSIRPYRGGEYVLSDRGNLSRDVVVVVGGNFVAGTVLGRISSSGSFTQLNPSASDGSETAAALLYGPTAAAGAPVRATAHVRSTEVNGGLLVWPDGISPAQQTAAIAQLAALAIVVRS